VPKKKNRERRAHRLTSNAAHGAAAEIESATVVAREMAKPGNLLNVLDQHLKTPACAPSKSLTRAKSKHSGHADLFVIARSATTKRSSKC